MDRRTFTIDEVAQQLGIARGTAYEMARQNKIPVIRIGNRYLVPKDDFEVWMKQSVKLEVNDFDVVRD